MSKYGVFSAPYFPVFSSNTGKKGPEQIPYLDTFHAVKVLGVRKDIQSIKSANYKNKVKYFIRALMRIQNPVNHVRWSILQKKLTNFAKHSILDVYEVWIPLCSLYHFFRISLSENCPNTESFLVRIFSYSGWIRTRKNSVFGHFLRSVSFENLVTYF